MRIKLTYVASLMAAGAASLAIVAAPTTAAAPLPKVCPATEAGTTCQPSITAEINNFPPAVNFYPYGHMRD